SYTIASASTTYLPIAASAANTNTTETNQQVLYRLAGTLSKGYMRVTTNARNATSYQTRINAADGNILISVGAGLTGAFTDNVNTDAVAAGDKLTWKFTMGTGTNNLIYSYIGVVFAATTNTVVNYGAVGSV